MFLMKTTNINTYISENGKKVYYIKSTSTGTKSIKQLKYNMQVLIKYLFANTLHKIYLRDKWNNLVTEL